MPAHALHHINIRAPAALVAQMKDFYELVLGLRAGWRPPFRSTGHWLYLGDLPVVHLVEDETVRAATAGRGPIVDHVAFACSGLAQIETLLAAHAIPYKRSEVPATTLVQLLCTDPAGNGVELQFDDRPADAA